jgi:cell division protein ZapB
MDADLKALEQKISTLIERYSSLRAENAKLKSDLNASLADMATLKANMLEASTRVEALMERLP